MMPWWLAHLIGDYLIQNDWMATRKNKQTIPCLIHGITYCLPFLLCNMIWWQIVLIGVEHFLQDRLGFARWFMRHTDHELFATGALSPWSIVVTDNVIHLVFIWLVTLL
jgi:hypothetical protein